MKCIHKHTVNPVDQHNYCTLQKLDCIALHVSVLCMLNIKCTVMAATILTFYTSFLCFLLMLNNGQSLTEKIPIYYPKVAPG